MSLRYPRGGILPDAYGLTLTVFCKDATKEKPVEAGTPLVFDSTAGEYGVRKAAAGEVPELYSKSNVSKAQEPLSAFVIGKYVRNVKVAISGTVAVGDSVEVGADGLMVKATAENGTLVMKVNDTNKTAEVLI